MTTSLQSAAEQEAKLASAVAQKHVALLDAGKVKTGLIDKAASGVNVTAADMRAAEEATRDAEAEHAIAKAVHGTALTNKHKAEVEFWREQAHRLEDGVAGALQDRITAAATLDAAIKAARDALAEFHNAGFNVQASRQAAFSFNGGRQDRAASNAVLAALQPAEQPRARMTPSVPVIPKRLFLRLFEVNTGFQADDTVSIASVEGLERGTWNVPAPAVVKE